MRTRDTFLGEIPNFENRLLYAMYTNKYDDDAESAWGYIDAGKELLEGHKPIEELKSYIDEYENTEGNNTAYDKAYILAYRDYIKQDKKESVVSEI